MGVCGNENLGYFLLHSELMENFLFAEACQDTDFLYGKRRGHPSLQQHLPSGNTSGRCQYFAPLSLLLSSRSFLLSSVIRFFISSNSLHTVQEQFFRQEVTIDCFPTPRRFPGGT